MAVAAALLVPVEASKASATSLPERFDETVLASGFQLPTTVDWAPDGRAFVAEKVGRVRVVRADGTVQPDALLDISDHVNSYRDRGLLGIAVDADFESNGYLYLLYVHESQPLVPDGPKTSRLTRVTVRPDGTVENPDSPETVILGKMAGAPCPAPHNAVDCIPADDPIHSIGTVRSDADGTLWVGSGDATLNRVDPRAFRTYDERSYAGKVLHVDREGRGLPGHPFCPDDADLSHVCTKLYAKGFRNPYRFTLRPGRRPAIGDVGLTSREELNLAAPGRNHGWPCYEGDIRTPGYRDTARCAEEYAKEGTPDAAAPPAWAYATPAGGTIVTGPVYSGDDYPDKYRGDLFVGDYVHNFVKHLDVDSNDRVVGVGSFATGWGQAPVDLSRAPDGALVYVDMGDFGPGSGTLKRIAYAPGAAAPTARASTEPGYGPSPLTVRFSGSESSDPDGDPLAYEWDFGDGSPSSSDADPVHTYTTEGVYRARLTVSDRGGRSSTTTVAIGVDRSPPTVEIATPADEDGFRGGQLVALRGSAMDPEQGPVPDSALTWRVLLHHSTHIHDVGSFAGPEAQFRAAEDHDADSFYEVKLTATDADGLAATRAVSIRPETVSFRLESSPPGAPLSYAGTARVASFGVLSAVGFLAPISAADRFTAGGRTYLFDRWGHGGARVQAVRIGASDSTLVATYRAVAPPAPSPTVPAPASPPAVSTPTRPAAPRDLSRPRMVIARRSLRASRRGAVPVRIRCPVSERSCTGTLTIRTVRRVGSGRNRKSWRRITMGSARFRLRGGVTKAVTVRLSRGRARLLGRYRRLRVRVAVSARDAAGNKGQTARVVVLSAPRKVRKKQHRGRSISRSRRTAASGALRPA